MQTLTITSTPPDRTEAIEYYFTYISKVPAGDIRTILETQRDEALQLYRGISEERSSFRYAPGKWSIREILNHINDTERVFVYRALWFARGFDLPLPSFDQDIAVAGGLADERSWESHVEEFRTIREASLTFFNSLPHEAWSRSGVASGNRFTVRAIAHILAGHVTHHNLVLRERYGI